MADPIEHRFIPGYDFVHELSEDCPCGPKTIPVERDDGSIGWVYMHHSLDGRELAAIPQEPNITIV